MIAETRALFPQQFNLSKVLGDVIMALLAAISVYICNRLNSRGK